MIEILFLDSRSENKYGKEAKTPSGRARKALEAKSLKFLSNYLKGHSEKLTIFVE